MYLGMSEREWRRESSRRPGRTSQPWRWTIRRYSSTVCPRAESPKNRIHYVQCDFLAEGTICPRSSGQFYIVSYYIK